VDNYEEIFKRDFDRLSYLYSKANTKSKKIKLSYDLILFEGLYNQICSNKIKFPWEDDPVLMNERMKNLNGFIKNVLKDQDILIKINTFEGTITIYGFNLKLEQLTDEDIIVKGEIDTIELERISD
jgi:hypothetical protein